MDIKYTLQVFTKINLKNSHLSLGDFEEVSRKLENVHFSENIGKTVVKNPKTLIEKVVFVLKMAIPYCQLSKDDSLFKLTYLNSECNKKIRPKVVKRILMKDNLDKKHRKALWKLISEISALCK
jgi:SOS response regulatory protein OraA/RecX